MMTSNAPLPPSDFNTPTPILGNRERLRTHLTPTGLAIMLLDAWKEDDPQNQARMLDALHEFNKADGAW